MLVPGATHCQLISVALSAKRKILHHHHPLAILSTAIQIVLRVLGWFYVPIQKNLHYARDFLAGLWNDEIHNSQGSGFIKVQNSAKWSRKRKMNTVAVKTFASGRLVA